MMRPSAGTSRKGCLTVAKNVMILLNVGTPRPELPDGKTRGYELADVLVIYAQTIKFNYYNNVVTTWLLIVVVVSLESVINAIL